VVLKFEKTDARHPQLKQERNVYMVSTNMDIPIAPKFVRYSESENLRYYEDKIDSPLTGWFNVLVMEQLGRDIMDVYEFHREVIIFNIQACWANPYDGNCRKPVRITPTVRVSPIVRVTPTLYNFMYKRFFNPTIQIISFAKDQT